MKPVAIFRHYRTEGPGYCAICLERSMVPWTMVCVDAGDPVPQDPCAFSGMVFMGGPMSVNDALPWIDPVLALIRAGVAAGIPVLGHCLGGQLMAKALGGQVSRQPQREIGWGEVTVEPGAEPQRWFGPDLASFTAFHWHGESFSLPPGAVCLLRSAYCENQAFAVGGHLALQCHVEMTAELIECWCHSGAAEIAEHPGPGVQSVREIQRDLAPRLAGLHAVADRLYARWIEGLVR